MKKSNKSEVGKAIDRVEGHLKVMGKATYASEFNVPNKVYGQAINSTISRTLNTSMTTLIVLLAIFIFGGASIMGFMFALIVGVVVGTYSSIFIATPVMYDTIQKKALKQEVEVEEEPVA